MAVSAAVAAVVIGGASAGYQANESREARKESKDAQKEQAAAQGRLEREARESQERTDYSRVAAEARRRQRARVATMSGRRDTILTSPSGAPGGQQYAATKQLLGQ